MTAPLVPLDCGVPTTNALYRWSPLPEPLLIKVYHGPRAWEHCRCERELLRLWREFGLPVPTVADHQVDALTGQPYLVLSHIPGQNLSQLLRAADEDTQRTLIARVFQENRRRHELALEHREIRLVHPDLNSRNIVIADEAPWYVDLESVPEELTPTRAIAIELAKLSRWLACDLGPGRVESVVRMLVDAYAGHERLLHRIVQHTYERSFQFFHRWRDVRLKADQPGLVTKYDIADCLRRMLPAAA